MLHPPDRPLHRPIGVFDSGVGGLTVLKALHRKLPHRDFLYLGDTARVPYGRKPREMVQCFAQGIASFLLEQNVAGIVIACNTASAAALPQLARELPIPVWGVIEPGVEAASRLTRTARVGVIGTRGTVASGAYQQRLEARGLTVWAQACPLFVHLVEENLVHSSEAELLARHYLAEHPPLDTLILGCTHYPLLRDVIQRVMGDDVRLVESAEVASEQVLEALGDEDPGHGPGHLRHYVTGDVLAYRHTAEVIGGVDGEIISLPVAQLIEHQPASSAA